MLTILHDKNSFNVLHWQEQLTPDSEVTAKQNHQTTVAVCVCTEKVWG